LHDSCQCIIRDGVSGSAGRDIRECRFNDPNSKQALSRAKEHVDNQRAITLLNMIAGLAAGLFVRSAAVEVVAYNPSLQDPSLGGVVSASMLAATVVGVVTFMVLHKHERATAFTNSAIDELRKVTWPSREDTTAQTTVVITAALGFGLLMFLYDFGWANLTKVVLYSGASS
jgi:preprotein translocase SecE subunit